MESNRNIDDEVLYEQEQALNRANLSPKLRPNHKKIQNSSTIRPKAKSKISALLNDQSNNSMHISKNLTGSISHISSAQLSHQSKQNVLRESSFSQPATTLISQQPKVEKEVSDSSNSI